VSVRFSFLMASNKVGRQFYDALDSILAQSCSNFEEIIVLNGLSQGELDLVLEQEFDPRVTIVYSKFRFLNCALNFGVEHCRGEYIVRMDSDDICDVKRLHWLGHAITAASTKPVVVYSDFDFLDHQGSRIKRHDGVQSLRKIYYRNIISHPTTAIRRESLLAVGGYLGSVFSEDYDLWARMLRHYGKSCFLYVPRKLLYYRMNGLGEARGSKEAYVGSAATQLRELCITGDARWLLGCVESLAKAVIHGR